MHTLKPGWKMVKFGDVVRQCKEKVDRSNNPFQRYIEGGHIDSEDIHIRRWGEFGSDYVGPAFHRIFRKGQVLYGSRRTYLKKVAVADFDGITANTTFVCETKDQNIFMQELLPFLMLTESFTNHSIRESKGSTNPYINWSDIAKYEFPLPPLEEQKRLAELLWAADETVLAYKKSLALFTKYFNNYIDFILSSPMFQQVDLENVLSKCIESGHSAPPNPDTADHWVLSLAALSEHGYIRGNIKPVAKTDKMIKASLKKGDLLISRSNTIEFVGFAGIFDEDRTDISFPDTMMRISVDTKRIIPEYLELVLLSRKGRTYMQKIASGTSNSMKKINKKTLVQFKFPLPPLDLQQRIVYYRYQKKFIEEYMINNINKLKNIILMLSGTIIGNSHV